MADDKKPPPQVLGTGAARQASLAPLAQPMRHSLKP